MSKRSVLAANNAVDAITALLNGGFLKIYTGTQPASPSDAITTQTLLATLGLGSPAFAPATNGIAEANAITPESNAPATGLATWFRLVRSNGVTGVVDGVIGTDLDLPDANIEAGAQVYVDEFQLQENLEGV